LGIWGRQWGKVFRYGDIGADPESVFYLHQEYCQYNDYQLEENSFILNYGWDKKK
jgi:hypothetical protein